MLLMLAAFASANWAMAPALTIFDPWAGTVYILAILVSEAWIIGRKLDQPWSRIIITCVAANLVTALFGFVLGLPTIGFVAVGGLANPNPLLTAILLLSIFGLLSGAFESLFWLTIRKETPKSKVFWNTMLAHAVGIPLGLFILLLPPRPYVGLEDVVFRIRRIRMNRAFQELNDDLRAGEPFPNVSSAPELMKYLAMHSRRYPKENVDLLATAYAPTFSRFSTGPENGKPLEFNKAVAGKKLSSSLKDPIWIVRSAAPYRWGFIYEPDRAGIIWTSGSRELNIPPDSKEVEK